MIYREQKKDIFEIAAAIIVFIFAFLTGHSVFLRLIFFLSSYIVAAYPIILKAVKNILHGKFFDENFLLSIATGGALAINAFPEAVAVMLFFRVGELIEDIAVNRSRRSIKSLLDIRPDHANLIKGKNIEQVHPKDVSIGNLIMVKPGERIPLDGSVHEGKSMVDTSPLTGESRPRLFTKGDEILSGMINKTGLLTVRVSKKFADSTVSKILDLVENATAKKSPTERFITRFARSYTPSVVSLAFLLATLPVLLYRIPLTAPLFTSKVIFSEWLYRALVFLVISCPCALVISIPLGFFGGIGAASRRGILIKGSNFLEGLNNLRTIVFDKTGTLTKGIFKVNAVVPCNGYSQDELLKLAAEAETHSNHPIAQSIHEAYGRKINEQTVEDFKEIIGLGVKIKAEGKEILAGNDQLLHQENIEHPCCYTEGTVVHIAVDKKYAGYITIADDIREEAYEAIGQLRHEGISKLIMFTGDSDGIAQSVSQKLKLDEYFAELLPHEKVEKIEALGKKQNKGRIAFVGDGINDAPVIARSDIGMAMGALGSDAAIEAADIVLMTDDLSKIPEAIQIARRTRTIVWQNIILALSIKAVIMTFAIFGIATMWEAVFADMGVAILSILNASRAIRAVHMSARRKKT
ncbi:MAG: cadmium-translocating P-type ATPase [Candidatus Cloacimonadota bacterium]|nr:MAG: cadmium-translocating P-type ATPase [Candidatus Cloacimonadota bacterium]